MKINNFFKKMPNLKRSQITSLTIIFFVILWIGSGLITGENPSNTRDANANRPVPQKEVIKPTVRVALSEALPFKTNIRVQGRTIASRKVMLKAEVRGKIENLYVQEGQKVTKDQPIAKIATNDRAARLKESRAVLEQRKIQVEAARKLAKQSFGTQVRLAEAEAQFRRAQADVVAYELELENTTIRAPFDGIFNTKEINIGDILNLGGDIGTIVDLNPIKVTGQISEQNITGYKVGMPGTVELINGDTFDGIISYVASVSDDKTRTFKVELTVENPNSTILGGLAAQLQLPKTEILAHRISPSALSLAEDGQIGVKTVNDSNKVNFWIVKILDDGPSGTWVSGLPDSSLIVVVGQDLIEEGQEVNPVQVTSSKEDQLS